MTGGATLLASTAFFHATASSAEAKLPEFQYDEEKLIEAPSGLKYADVVVGTGASPTKGQTIQAHYTGRLTNGRTFDSSYERGSPLKFKVGVHQVIQGWDDGILGAEGVEGMKVGGKRVLIIPPELGYGARGAGGVIPGNATLKFDVELVAVL
jgi:peptidylprolyl isomerase